MPLECFQNAGSEALSIHRVISDFRSVRSSLQLPQNWERLLFFPSPYGGPHCCGLFSHGLSNVHFWFRIPEAPVSCMTKCARRLLPLHWATATSDLLREERTGQVFGLRKIWEQLTLCFPTRLQQKGCGIAIKCCFLGGFVPSGPWSERAIHDASEMHIVLSSLSPTSSWGKRISYYCLWAWSQTQLQTPSRHSFAFGSSQSGPTGQSHLWS